MRIIFALLLLLNIVPLSSYAQNQEMPPPPPPMENEDKNLIKIFTKVETEAQFPGGDTAWRNFLIKNLDLDNVGEKIKYPRGKKEFKQTLIVKFIVSKDSSISSIAVENKDADENCIAEAIRVFKLSPKWIPAQQNGRVVNAYRRQPITFYFQK